MERMHKRSPAFLLALMFCAGIHVCAQEHASNAPEEIFIRLRYDAGSVSEIVNALSAGDSIYLPVSGMFALLHVYTSADSGIARLHGFYISRQRPYAFDCMHHCVIIGKETFALTPDEFKQTDLDLFLTASAFYRFFRLRIDIDFRQLAAVLTTEDKLPIAAELERDERLQITEAQKKNHTSYPLLSARQKPLLGGGVLDYTITGAHSEEGNAYNGTFRAGAEVLGGEFNGTLNVSADSSRLSGGNQTYQWKYVFDDSKIISQASLGVMDGYGLTSSQFRGIQLSSQPVVPRMSYQTIAIQEQLKPDWTVELYADEKLIDSRRTDALGNVQFDVPLMYGTNDYTLRMYGPTGEVEVERKRIQIPFVFLPPQELDMIVNAGSLYNEHFPFYQVHALYGIDERLTNRVSFEYIDDTLRRRPVLNDVLSIRLGQSILADIDIAPSVHSSADVQVILPSRVQYGITAASYKSDPYYNSTDKKSDIQANYSIPFNLERLQLALLSTADWTQYSGSRNESLTFGTSVSPGSWSVNLQERIGRTESGGILTGNNSSLTAALLYGLPRAVLNFSSAGDLLLNASVTYDQEAHNLSAFGCNLSSSLFTAGRCQLGIQRDMINNLTVASLLLTFDFDFMRTTTSLQAGDHPVQTQTISGALVYNGINHSIDAYGLPWEGTTGAAFRMFLDENGNGIYDTNETLVEGGSVNLEHAASFQKSSKGVVTIWELLPYERYNVDIRDVAIVNNLWVPKQKSFSFIAEPNTLKIIDVPFVAVGMIEGTVLRASTKGNEPVAGLKVTVEGITNSNRYTIPLFQDGSLYYVGIPPGKYKIAIDSAQLAMLNCIAEPAKREFEIRATSQGDEISGLDFLLRLIPSMKK